MRYLAGIAAVLWLAGCAQKPAAPAARSEAPAKVLNPIKEAQLSTIQLTEKAEERLKIATQAVEMRTLGGQRKVAGELLMVPGRVLMAVAPIGGVLRRAGDVALAGGVMVKKDQPIFQLTPLLPLQRDLKATYESDVATAKARFDAARLQLDRARQLLKDLAGSQRNVEQAEQEFQQSKALLDAANERLERLKAHPLDADVDVPVTAPLTGMIRQVLVTPGQTVSGGAALFEVIDTSRLWVRVPVYTGDLKEMGNTASVVIDDMAPGGVRRQAQRTAAPPTGDPLAVTVDLYYEIDNADQRFRPGQKVGVALPLASQVSGLVVPGSAIVYDPQGGAWLYVASAPHAYTRKRVEVARNAGSDVVLAMGPKPGERVVIAGVAELFGTEFGAGK